MGTLSRAFEHVLFTLGVLGLGAAALERVDGLVFVAREGRRLEAVLAGEGRLARSSPAPGMTRRLAAERRAWGRLVVPQRDVSSLVVDGFDDGALRVAVGHLPQSAFPGEGDNVALAGHRDSTFRGLKDVVAGDVVWLYTPDGMFEYRVQWTAVVEPARTDVVAPIGEPALTLVTCYPFSYVGRAPLRFIVRARLAAAPASGPDTDEASVPPPGGPRRLEGPREETG